MIEQHEGPERAVKGKGNGRNSRSPKPVYVRGRNLYLVPERRVARASHVPPGRTLHLIDVENLMGGPLAGVGALKQASELYRIAAPVRASDHVIVASNPRLACDAGVEWQAGRLVTGHGPNGADRALLRAVRDLGWVAERYDRIVIGSGDGVFVGTVRALKEYGVAVGVVAIDGCLSKDLDTAATFVRLLPDPSGLKVVA